MKLLLDTHALIWWLEGSTKLGPAARHAIASEDSAVWVSAASAWEIAIKAALGRLTFSEPLEDSLPRELDRSGFQPLAITIAHGLATRTLPEHHADPFDRLLIVQARAEGLALLTADRVFKKYDVQLIDASR